jgi:hypothetical protein
MSLLFLTLSFSSVYIARHILIALGPMIFCPQLFPICSLPGFVLVLKTLPRLNILNILPIFGRGCCTLASTLPVWKQEPMRLWIRAVRAWWSHCVSVRSPLRRLSAFRMLKNHGNRTSRVGKCFVKSDNNLSTDGDKLHKKLYRSRPHSRRRLDGNCSPCHNVLKITVHLAVSSIRDSDALRSVYRTDITWSHCSQSFSQTAFADLAFIWTWISLTVKRFTSHSLFPRYVAVVCHFSCKFWGSNE